MNLPTLKSNQLKLILPACGGLALALRVLLYATGVDEKGLFAPAHPAWIGILLLTAAAAALIGLNLRTLRGPADYPASFPRSPLGAAGCTLAAVSAVLAAFSHFRSGPVLFAGPSLTPTLIFYLNGAVMVLAAVSFAAAAFCRLGGKQTHFPLHCLICVYFAVRLLAMYQEWSFDPQLQNYCFQLLACIALTMTAYQLALFDLDKGSHRKLWAWGLSAVYLCCVCLGTADDLLFLAGGVWAFTNLSTLRRPRRTAVVTD